jgi:apolipoprotein N-acyltransferase
MIQPEPALHGSKGSASTAHWKLAPARVAVALAAGVLQGWSLAWPGTWSLTVFPHFGLASGQPVWWLQILALGMLAGLLQPGAGYAAVSWRAALVYGAVFSTAWLCVAFGWLYVAMHTYGGLPALAAGLAVLVLAALLGLYHALACAAFRALRPVNANSSAIFFAAFWLLAELARGTLLTGFGWGAAAYAHLDGPLIGFAPWLGTYGIGALAAWLVMLLVMTVRAPAQVSGRARLGNVLLVGLVLTLPVMDRAVHGAHTEPTGRLDVALLQGNIPQDEKFEAGSGVPVALQWYGEQLQQSSSALVIAPETALPLLPQQLPAGYWAALQQRFATGTHAALIGMPLGDFEQGYTNSVIGLRPGDAQPWRYDKHHLVPFGEFIPPGFRWFTELMQIPLGDFAHGALAQPPFEWRGQRLGPNVCYEDLFGEELAQQFRDSTRAPTVLVNVSNLAWFGTSAAMDQHLQIARLRAREFERPFLLATNTGVTAILDHQARVLRALPRDTRGVLRGEVEGRTGITPYAWWVARVGLWPYGLTATAVLLWGLFRMRKRW